MPSPKRLRVGEPDIMAMTGCCDPECDGAGGCSSSPEAPGASGGAKERISRACSAREPIGPDAGRSASGGAAGSASSSSSGESVPEPSDLQEQLRILAQLQQCLLDRAGEAGRHGHAKSRLSELKDQIAVQRNKVQAMVPARLWPLFSRKAALYLATPERIAVLDRLLLPSPQRESIQDDGRDWEQVLHAVRLLFTSRANMRVFGAVVGFPGMGKTYLFRRLLHSQVISAPAPTFAASASSASPPTLVTSSSPVPADAATSPAAPTPAPADDAAVLNWWRSLPVFVISFNGITKASSEDLRLAAFHEQLPGVIRLLHSESLKMNGGSHFLAFRAGVLELLKSRDVSPSTLLLLADYVMLTRCRKKPSSTKDVGGILLVDELVHLSRVPPSSSPTCHVQPGQVFLSSSGSPRSRPASLAISHGPVPASASSEPVPDTGRPAASNAGPALNWEAAEKSRSALCAFAGSNSLMLCVTSLSESFVNREATSSGSVPVPIGVLQLVEETRVARAVGVALANRSMGFQVTSLSGEKSTLSPETVGACLGVLAGGHPRAVEVLLSSIEASRDGEPFLGKLLSLLYPTNLSLAASSIGVLCDHPAVIAVGLLGYEAAPEMSLCGELSWDHVYAQGALTRGVLHGVSGRPSRAAARRGASAGPVYSTRLNVAFLLEVLNRKERRPTGGTTQGGRSPVSAVEDEDIYRALQGVRAALETGDVSMAWERFVLRAFTAVSQARRICSAKLPSLVRDGLPQPLLHKTTLLDLFPASPPFMSTEEWLHETRVDASHAFVGVKLFRNFDELLVKSDEELLRYIWQPDIPNFPAVDGVMFFRCAKSKSAQGPQGSEVVGVLLQFKHKVRINFEMDVIQSAAVAAKDFKAAAGGSTWARRVVFVVLSRWQLPFATGLDLTMGNSIPVIVVGESEMHATFGPGLHALVRSSPIAFGTQVVDMASGVLRTDSD